MTSAALHEFFQDLERVRRLLDLITSYKAFGASVAPEAVTTEALSWDEAVQLHAAAGAVRTDLPLMAGAILLYAAGRFEFFIRQCVETTADGLAAKGGTFDKLPAALQRSVRDQVLLVAQSPRKWDYDDVFAEGILSQYVASKQGASPVPVPSSVLSLTESNMRPEILSEILKRVGITDFWRTVGKQLPAQLLLSESDDAACAKAIQARLSALMTLRNQIAHPTASTNFPSPEEVSQELKLLEVIAQVADDVADMAVASYVPSA